MYGAVQLEEDSQLPVASAKTPHRINSIPGMPRSSAPVTQPMTQIATPMRISPHMLPDQCTAAVELGNPLEAEGEQDQGA